MIAVKFLKAWKGEVSVAPDATLGQLLAALQAASSIEPAACASLIAKGKKIDLGTASRDARIDALGIVHNTPVMLVCHDAAVLTMLETEKRMKRLADVEAAARLISDRDGGGLLEMSLTNQDGSAVSMPEADRKALSLGMLLHAKGRQLLDASSQSLLSHTYPVDQPAAAAAAAGIEAFAAEAGALQEAVQYLEVGRACYGRGRTKVARAVGQPAAAAAGQRVGLTTPVAPEAGGGLERARRAGCGGGASGARQGPAPPPARRGDGAACRPGRRGAAARRVRAPPAAARRAELPPGRVPQPVGKVRSAALVGSQPKRHLGGAVVAPRLSHSWLPQPHGMQKV